MLRFLGGVLALALLMGTTATQADAASKAGMITAISAYGNGPAGAGCQFRVLVTYGRVHSDTVRVSAELWTGTNYIAGNSAAASKGGTQMTVIFNANVTVGSVYRFMVTTDKLVKGSYYIIVTHQTNTFTEGASCGSSTTTPLAVYPTP